MTAEAIDTGKGKRIYWIDNLRTFMIFLVVLIHAGIVYESSGIGAYISWIVLDPTTNDLSGILSFIILDIFVIATLFFVAGFFAPRAEENKQGWAFLKSRFIRLILPWFVAVITMIPLYNVIFLSSRNLPQADWTTYFHFTGRTLTSQNWLWFLPILFCFNIVYFLLAKINIKVTISFKLAVLITSIITVVYSVCMVIFGLTGWTKTAIVDFQNERLLIYFMVFLLGALAYRRNIFEEKPTRKKLYIFTLLTAWIPIMAYTILRLVPVFNPGGTIFSAGIDLLLYWISFSLSLLCLVYLMVETFRRYVDRTSRVWSELNKNSYGVYIIHVIVLGAIAMFLLNFTMPSLLKYLTLTLSTFLVSNLLISLYRRAVSATRILVAK
jgi:peptidoglycan/LPS O-acetylase OafA/YrhL